MKQMESSNVIQKQTNGCLSAMQQFFLNIISQSNKELNPCYLASIRALRCVGLVAPQPKNSTKAS